MSRRCVKSLFALAALVATIALLQIPLSAQRQTTNANKSAAAAPLPRTPWGAPDLQGVWDYRMITPLQRPDSFAGKAVLSDEEAAAYESRENQRQNRDLVDRVRGN